MKTEASYICPTCGEKIMTTIDMSAGAQQKYVEDCPVCCRPNVIHVEIDPQGELTVRGERESD